MNFQSHESITSGSSSIPHLLPKFTKLAKITKDIASTRTTSPSVKFVRTPRQPRTRHADAHQSATPSAADQTTAFSIHRRVQTMCTCVSALFILMASRAAKSLEQFSFWICGLASAMDQPPRRVTATSVDRNARVGVVTAVPAAILCSFLAAFFFFDALASTSEIPVCDGLCDPTPKSTRLQRIVSIFFVIWAGKHMAYIADDPMMRALILGL